VAAFVVRVSSPEKRQRVLSGEILRGGEDLSANFGMFLFFGKADKGVRTPIRFADHFDGPAADVGIGVR
jgi:hypothetical protein